MKQHQLRRKGPRETGRYQADFLETMCYTNENKKRMRHHEFFILSASCSGNLNLPDSIVCNQSFSVTSNM